MSEDSNRIVELARQGFCCSQVLAILGLEAQGKTDPDLVRTVQGLCGGIGSSGEVCGALTGGVCVLSLFGGRGTVEEATDFQLSLMLRDLIDWFTTEYGTAYGSIRCREILAGSKDSKKTRCPTMIVGTWEKVKELLLANGYKLEAGAE